MRHALVVSYYAPQTDRDTGSRRVMDVIEALLGDGWQVTFAAVHPDGSRYERALQARGVVVRAAAALEAIVTAEAFGLAVLSYWPVAERYLPDLRRLSPQTRVIVDSIDLHFLRYARQLLASGDRVLDQAYGDELVGELNTYAAADAVLAVSDKEAEIVADFTGDAALAWAVPLAVTTDVAPAPLGERRGSVFVGNFQHAPNAEAVEFLCRDVVPRLDPAVLARHPFYVVGSGLTDAVRQLGDGVSGVRMVGWVPDLSPYLARTRAAVVPLRHGAGVKGKLLEAMAAGLPAVATSVGVEGVAVRHDGEVLVADSAADFARAWQRLLTDDAVWTRVAAAAQACVARHLGAGVARQRFLAAVAAVFARPAKALRVPPRTLDRAAQYDTRLRFQDRHRGSRPVREVVRTASLPPSPRGEGPRVLVVGVCLTDKPNTAATVVAAVHEARWCRVTQRWAALGQAPAAPQVAAVTALTATQPTPKFALVNQLLHDVDLTEYDYVLMCDDDIGLPDDFVDRFIGHQHDLDFALAQPARTRRSYIDHPIVEQQLGVRARRTQFVEIGPVVSVHRSAFAVVFPFDLISPMGWGYENVWALDMQTRRLRMGIIDATPVDHVMRPPLAHYSWESGDAGRAALFAKRAHLPLDECLRVLDVYAAST